MVRSIKLLSYVAGCCGIVLLMLALVAMPPGFVRADDPEPIAIDPPATPQDGLCALYGNYAKNCTITYYPIDPCTTLPGNWTCNKSAYVGVCTCK